MSVLICRREGEALSSFIHQTLAFYIYQITELSGVFYVH
jgi:hypothetical protein